MVSMGAVITIEEDELASSWDGSSRVALDGLAITWGRDDPYDETDPGTLSMSVIDPTGQWAASQTLSGKSVRVTRTVGSSSVTMFRGNITRATLERRKIYNPTSRVREPVWVVAITAGDRLAAAAATVIPGEMGDGSIEGLGGWGEQSPATRLTNLMDFGANQLFAERGRVANDVLGNGTIIRRMHGAEAADRLSVLELFAQAFKLIPLGAVGYDPDTETITIASFAAASNVVLVYSGGVVSVQLPTGRVLDAARVAVPDGLTGETTTADAIDVVQLSYWWYGKDPNLTSGSQKRVTYTNPFIQRRTARAATSGTSRVLKVDTQAMFLDPSEFVSGAVDAYNRFPAWLADQITAIVNTLNGQLRLPSLRLDHERLPLDAAATEILYRPFQSTTPLYFAGSVFNTLPNAGPQFQIIGGTLRFERGWKHDVTLCAARSSFPASLTITQLFGTSSAAKIGQFDPSIRIGDLANITQGL